MDLADLVAAVTRVGTLAAFLCGGLVLVGVRQLLERPTRTELMVRVPRGASDAARERIIDEAVLVEVGLGLGWRQDPLIRDRLARTMGRLASAGDDPGVEADVLARAAAIDLPRRDRLVRARLAERARKTLPEPGTPSDAELLAFAAAHSERFVPPATVTFEHRFAPKTIDATRLAHLVADASDPGLPELTLGPRPTRSLPALANALGPAAAELLATVRVGVWTRIDSPIGHHLVRVLERTTPSLPPLAAIHPQVLAAWRDARRPELEREALAKLRTGFEIDVVQ